MKKNIFFGILIYAIMVSCSNSNQESLSDPNAKILPANIKSIFDNKCISCHSSLGTQKAYTTYTQIKNDIDLILFYISDDTMPQAPIAPLTPEQKQLLIQWKADGFPEGK